jgi:hypothetical protein
MKKNILGLTGALVLIFTVVWVVGAQRPEPPLPLPAREEVVPTPEATRTRTPAPDEDASNDVLGPTVTPIPFKEVIDHAPKDVPDHEKVGFVIQKENGDYIRNHIT